MISVYDAATRLNVHRNVILRMIHNGDLPAYRLPGRNGYWMEPDAVTAACAPIPVTPTTATEQHTVTVNEAAQMLQCDPRTVRRLVTNGTLPAQRFPGGRSRIRLAAATVQEFRRTCTAAVQAN